MFSVSMKRKVIPAPDTIHLAVNTPRRDYATTDLTFRHVVIPCSYFRDLQGVYTKSLEEKKLGSEGERLLLAGIFYSVREYHTGGVFCIRTWGTGGLLSTIWVLTLF